MTIYKYKAMDSKGRIHKGQSEAINDADLEIQLSKLKLDLINYKKAKSFAEKKMSLAIKRRDLITFCFHLEHTFKAGLPILESLQDLRDSTENKSFAEIINTMIRSVEGGQTLSQALSQFELVFDKIFINLVKAGEDSGELNQIFEKLGDSLKWQDEQAANVKKLLVYPCFVAVSVICVVIFLMVYIVPELLRFINNMGQELPIHTKILVLVSNAVANYWHILLISLIIILIITYMFIRKVYKFNLMYDALKLKIPIIGTILKKIILTRLSNIFAIMYASGINIVDCIHMSEEISGNKHVEKAIHHIRQQIIDGKTISDSFSSSGLFPPFVLRMIYIGENTGALHEALLNISYFYDRDVRESINRLQLMIEPIMTITLGAIIAWIMFSVLGPIYDLIAKIKV